MKIPSFTVQKGFILLFSILIYFTIFSCLYSEDLPVSSDAIGFGEVHTNKSDPGMAWMITQWLKSPKKNYLKTLTRNYTTEKSIAVAYDETGNGDLGFGIITQTKQNLESAKTKSNISHYFNPNVTPPKYHQESYSSLKQFQNLFPT